MDNSNKYNLEERTALLGENVIFFCKLIKITIFTEPLVKQILRSATSVGANYMEANGASSKKDFTNKIHICKKEIQETKHWLRMIEACCPEKKLEIKPLWQEAQELTLIFSKIASSSRTRIEN